MDFLLPTTLMLHLNLILQYMIALDFTRKYVIMIIQTIKDTYKFYWILFCFIISYFLVLMLSQEEGLETPLDVWRAAYTLTLAELVGFDTKGSTNFFIFMIFTLLITLVLMNLIIAILSDAYELVQSERKYYDGQAKIERSLMFERLAMFFLKLSGKEKD